MKTWKQGLIALVTIISIGFVACDNGNSDITTYTVTFNGNGNTGGTAPDAITENTGTAITIPDEGDLVRTNYYFVGWNTSANGSGTGYAVGTPYKNISIILYAQWTINTYTVTFDSNGGDEVPNQIINHNSMVTKPFTDRTGFSIDYWFNTANEAVWDFNTDVVTADITLKAKWIINTYTVTFNSMGGTVIDSINDVPHGDMINSAPTSPTSGYGTFEAWYSNEDRTILFVFGTTTVTNNITLYAKWNATYEIGAIGPGTGRIFYRNELGFPIEGYMGEEGSFAAYTAHYLEAAPDYTLPVRAAEWGAYLVSIGNGLTTFQSTMDPLASKIGNGRKDTQIIVNYLSTTSQTGRAAQTAAAQNFGDLNDWFLPSLGELFLLYAQRNLQGIGITTVRVWSSSQAYSSEAWIQDFADGGRGFGQKTYTQWVRAVRAF